MSALAFTNSIHFQDASKCRQFLIDKGVEIPEGMTDALPVQAFHGFFTQEAIANWDREATVAELKEKAQGAWKEWIDTECSVDTFKQKSEGIAEGADLKYRKVSGRDALVINSPQMVQWVLEQLEQKKADVIDAKFAELCPKKKSKATGKRAAKRDNSEFELVVKNTPEKAQGKDYKYHLPSDSNEVFLKDGKITKVFDGGKDIKPQTYKAVKKEKPFLTQGGCCGAITWDRASGSKCLKDLNVKGAFMMGCSNHPTDGSDFCVKCEGKKDNVYTSKYKSGKYKGYTYAQVLWILDEKDVSDGGKVLADGDNGWVQDKCGVEWINTYQ
tara:strand:- start:620 stop:1603 length:984 start_codon:yes stop_codon:yes gene_type:complete